MLTFRNTQQHAQETSEAIEFKRGFKASIPVLIGLIPCALVLGNQASHKGLSLLEIPLLTGLNFAGGSEFAILEVWTSPPQILLLMFITLLVNSRHLLMGANLVPYLKHLPNKKALPALFFMCDEVWALSVADANKRNYLPPKDAFSLPFYVGISFALYVMWVVFTTLGGAIGSTLGDISKWGFDMAFPAIFLVLLRSMLPSVKAALPWVVSLGTAILAYLYLPSGWHVPVGAICGVVTAMLTIQEKTEPNT
ncbi:AzlC family ABC transporter permease [Acinetobacter sp. B5B]|uniref:AzlC family ABC transporter permease n=1 Tax=Acinetobacter baretiae TaxID=2605383 RepID=UPI0018C23B43|nr:AzlC family ABC transporter permease [Acinetobacter baretiae]MBF7682011.1 AzlC family ABC transporter permease [Acinetobacter baretiae]